MQPKGKRNLTGCDRIHICLLTCILISSLYLVAYCLMLTPPSCTKSPIRTHCREERSSESSHECHIMTAIISENGAQLRTEGLQTVMPSARFSPATEVKQTQPWDLSVMSALINPQVLCWRRQASELSGLK